MWFLRALFLLMLPRMALACGAPVCLVDPDSLGLTQIITFDDQRSGGGPGLLLDEVLIVPGARFGVHFAGQTVTALGPHDKVSGAATNPPVLLSGRGGQGLSLVNFYGNTVLNGYGPAGYPKREAQGEGAIAILFDHAQSAIAFDLRGGEGGRADVLFLRGDGSVIDTVTVEPTGEFAIGFVRHRGIGDIVGVVITNTDPQGLAIDTLRFGKPLEIG